MSKDNYYGALEDTYSLNDWQLAGGFDIKKAKFTFKENNIQYNQNDVSSVSCTLMSAIGAYSDLTGKRIQLEDSKRLWKLALNKGAKEGWGWYIHQAVDLVRMFMEDVSSFRVEVGSDEFFDVLEKGYSVVGGYRGNKLYNEDFLEDGVLDELAFGESTYGHAIRISKDDDKYSIIIDNYKGIHKYNVYKVSKEHFFGLIENGVFFRSGFVFLLKDTYHLPKQKAPLWALKSVEKAIKKGIIKSSQDLHVKIGDHFMEGLFYKMKLFTKKEGNVSLVRFLVAMDRNRALD